MTETRRPASPIDTCSDAAGPQVNTKLRRSYAHCRRVARRRARNFYYGLILTPQPQRSALYAIYGFMRACDDLADEPAGSGGEEQRIERLDAFRHRLQAALAARRVPADNPAHAEIWPAFLDVMQRYPVDAQCFYAMLDGQRADLRGAHYETFEQTYDYCYKVAGTVGQVCLEVWGYGGGHATIKLAEYRGVALQLTNILRDLAEDAQRDRVYLPREDFKRFGFDPGNLSVATADESFDRLMLFEVERARSYYQKSAELELHVDPACRATCWAMMRIYRGLLEKIARDPRRVLRERVQLSAGSKALIAITAACKRWSPVAAFRGP